MSTLQLHGPQHARLPCPSPSPRICSDSVMPSNHLILCHPFSSWLQSFPASGSFAMSRLFTSSGQSIGASASVLSMNIQDWSPLGLTGLISLQSKGLSRVFSSAMDQKHQLFGAHLLRVNSHIYTWLLESTVQKAEHRKMMLLNCGVGEDSWESPGLQGDPTSPS